MHIFEQFLTVMLLIISLMSAECYTAVVWDTKQSRLALCTGTNKVYMWSPKGSLSVQIPCEGDLLSIEIVLLSQQ